MPEGVTQKAALANYTQHCERKGIAAPKKTAWGAWMRCVSMAAQDQFAIARGSLADFDKIECGEKTLENFLEAEKKTLKDKREKNKKKKTAKKVPPAASCPLHR